MKETLITFLVIDDDDIDAMTIQRAFKMNHILNPLFIAYDGIEALDKLRGTNGEAKISPAPCIILLDVNMPRMDGIEFLKELRTDPDFNKISVFVLITSNDDKDRIESCNYNVAGYITKPVTFESLVAAIATLKNGWQLYGTDR